MRCNCRSRQWTRKVTKEKGFFSFSAIPQFPSRERRRGRMEVRGVRYKMSHSSEQRPQTSNSQLSWITLSGPTDRAVDGFVVRGRVRGQREDYAGEMGSEWWEEKEKLGRCVLKSFALGAVPLMKETIHRGRLLAVSDTGCLTPENIIICSNCHRFCLSWSVFCFTPVMQKDYNLQHMIRYEILRIVKKKIEHIFFTWEDSATSAIDWGTPWTPACHL